jgi:5-formyltetrahydrofolate cyclo-ligase
MARGICKVARRKTKVNIQESKTALRKQIRERLKKMPAAARIAASVEICSRLREQSFWKNSTSILFFSPLPGEPDIWPLLVEALAAGKTCALPQFNASTETYVARRVQNLQKEIITGKFGIREPSPECPKISTTTIELVMVPGVAFDMTGRRLGRGRGYYDRLLQKISGLKVGIAFDGQNVETIPAEAHDARVDYILTPARCAKCAR